ncbi:MAG: hypothetical protein PHG99_00900 [Erysipelotrichaceae bacterium]|nr:hypothetical protein [Erysipelotrichaceae bacterium]
MTLSINNQSINHQHLITTNKLSERLLLSVLKMDMLKTFKNLFLENTNLLEHSFSDGTLLIHQAAKYNASLCLDYLLKQGVDHDCLSLNGKRPLEYALEAKADKTIKLLQKLDAKAYDLSLIDLIDQENDVTIKKRSLMIAEIFIETDIIIDNLKQYLEILISHKLINKQDKLLLLSMKMIMKANQIKLNKIIDFGNIEDKDLDLIKRYLTLSTIKKKLSCFDRLNRYHTQYENLIIKLSDVDNIDNIDWELLERYNKLITETELRP